jgi:hypothetical protein
MDLNVKLQGRKHNLEKVQGVFVKSSRVYGSRIQRGPFHPKWTHGSRMRKGMFS